MDSLSVVRGKFVLFQKWHGLGNNFIILDLMEGGANESLVCEHVLANVQSVVVSAANVKTGLGCDQFVLICDSTVSELPLVRFFNPDGSESGACGNASRCVARILADEFGIDGGAEVSFLTGACDGWGNSRVLSCSVLDGDRVSVNMGKVRSFARLVRELNGEEGDSLATKKIGAGDVLDFWNLNLEGMQGLPLRVLDAGFFGLLDALCSKVQSVVGGSLEYDAYFVDVGNPHLVVIFDGFELDSEGNFSALEGFSVVDIEAECLEMQKKFGYFSGVNVELCLYSSAGSGDVGCLYTRVFERGAGETNACGTGACAVAVSVLRGGVGHRFTPALKRVDVLMRGVRFFGDAITVSMESSENGQSEEDILMAGGVKFVADGRYSLDSVL